MLVLRWLSSFSFLYSTEVPSSGIGAAHIQGGSHLGTPSLIHSGRIDGGRKRGMEMEKERMERGREGGGRGPGSPTA